MANEEHVKIVLAGKDAIEQWRKDNPRVRLDLPRADLTGADLTGADLTRADLTGANLTGAYLYRANLTWAILYDANLTGANLYRANLTGANLYDANLTGAYLDSTILTGAKLRAANLTGANLIRADIRGATVDSDTQFKDLKSVIGLHVDRSTVEYMFPNPLTRGPKMMDMYVVDDLATLRASFSGFTGWIYWIGLIALLLPPVWFVCVQAGTTEAVRAANSWVRENPQFVPQIPERTTHEPAVSTPAETITLLEAVGRYLFNGGRGWRDGWKLHWTFILFLVSGAYRIASFSLLADTVKRVNEQEFSGTPARFSFTQPFQCRILWVSKLTVPLGTYQSWYDWNRWLSFVVAAIAIITLLHHLQMLIVVR